jgi:hypothetical protein
MKDFYGNCKSKNRRENGQINELMVYNFSAPAAKINFYVKPWKSQFIQNIACG